MLTAAVTAAVVLAASTSFVASGQEATPSPDAIPSPMADASAVPSFAASPVPVGTVAGDAVVDAGPRRLVVEAGDLWFAPNEITIPADEPTALVLSGIGAVAHNLMVDELGLQLYVGPGIESEVTVSDLPPGTYTFYCSIFGHRRSGMYGTLTVE